MVAFISRRRSAVALGASAVLAVGLAASQIPPSASARPGLASSSSEVLPYQDPIPASRVTRSTTEAASSTRACGPRARENLDGASGGRAAGIEASRTVPYAPFP